MNMSIQNTEARREEIMRSGSLGTPRITSSNERSFNKKVLERDQIR